MKVWLNADISWKNIFFVESKCDRDVGFPRKCPGKFLNFDAIFPGHLLINPYKWGVIRKLRSSTTDPSRPSKIEMEEPDLEPEKASDVFAKIFDLDVCSYMPQYD